MSRAPWRTHDHRPLEGYRGDAWSCHGSIPGVPQTSSTTRPAMEWRPPPYSLPEAGGDGWKDSSLSTGLKPPQGNGTKRVLHKTHHQERYVDAPESSPFVAEHWRPYQCPSPSGFYGSGSPRGVTGGDEASHHKKVPEGAQEGKTHPRYADFESRGPCRQKSLGAGAVHKQVLNVAPQSGPHVVQQLLRLLSCHSGEGTASSLGEGQRGVGGASCHAAPAALGRTESSNSLVDPLLSPPRRPSGSWGMGSVPVSNPYDGTFHEASDKGSNLAKVLGRLQDKRMADQSSSCPHLVIEHPRLSCGPSDHVSPGPRTVWPRPTNHPRACPSSNFGSSGQETFHDGAGGEKRHERLYSYRGPSCSSPSSSSSSSSFRRPEGQWQQGIRPHVAHYYTEEGASTEVGGERKTSRQEGLLHSGLPSSSPCGLYGRDQSRGIAQGPQGEYGPQHPSGDSYYAAQMRASQGMIKHDSPSVESGGRPLHFPLPTRETSTHHPLRHVQEGSRGPYLDGPQPVHLSSELQSILSRLSKESARGSETTGVASSSSGTSYLMPPRDVPHVSNMPKPAARAVEWKSYRDLPHEPHARYHWNDRHERKTPGESHTLMGAETNSMAASQHHVGPPHFVSSEFSCSDIHREECRRYTYSGRESSQGAPMEYGIKLPKPSGSPVDSGKSGHVAHPYVSPKRCPSSTSRDPHSCTGWGRVRCRDLDEKDHWGEPAKRLGVCYVGHHSSSRSSESVQRVLRRVRGVDVSEYPEKTGRQREPPSSHFSQRLPRTSLGSQASFASPHWNAPPKERALVEPFKVTRVSVSRHGGGGALGKHPRLSPEVHRPALGRALPKTRLGFQGEARSSKVSLVSRTSRAWRGSFSLSSRPGALGNKKRLPSRRASSPKHFSPSGRGSLSRSRVRALVMGSEGPGGMKDPAKVLSLAKTRRRGTPKTNTCGGQSTKAHPKAPISGTLIAYHHDFQKSTEELLAQKVCDVEKADEPLVAAPFLCCLRSFKAVEGDAVGSYRIQNHMPRLWVLSSLYFLETMWTRIKNVLLNGPSARIQERYSPCLLITRLPNVNASALQRALSNHFKSLRLAIEKITLPVYPETGLSMGWCILDVGNQWNSVQDILFAPQFQWRGMCTHILPLPCPQLIQLNGVLSVAPQRLKKHYPLNVGDWTTSGFDTLCSALYPTMMAFLKGSKSEASEPSPNALSFPSSGASQASYLHSPVPFMCVTSSRRLELAVPIVAPNSITQLSSLVINNTLESGPEQYTQPVCGGEHLSPGVTYSSFWPPALCMKDLCCASPQGVLTESEPGPVFPTQDVPKSLENPPTHSDEAPNSPPSTWAAEPQHGPKESVDDVAIPSSGAWLPLSNTDSLTPLEGSPPREISSSQAAPLGEEPNGTKDTQEVHAEGHQERESGTVVDRDMDVSQSDEDVLGAETVPAALGPTLSQENPTGSANSTSSPPPNDSFPLATSSLNTWSDLFMASPFPHPSTHDVLSTVMSSALPLPPSRNSMETRGEKVGHPQGRLLFPDFSEIRVDGESLVVKPITREDDFGFLSMFQFGNHALLGWDLLFLCAEALFLWSKSQHHENFNQSIVNVAAPWTSALDDDAMEGLQRHRLCEILYAIKPVVPSLLPDFEVLPYLLYISGISNVHVDGDRGKAPVTQQLLSALGLHLSLDDPQVWGPQYFIFPETNRFRGHGFLLLPSFCPIQQLNTQTCQSPRSLFQEHPYWRILIDLDGAQRPMEIHRVLVPSTEFIFDLQVISVFLFLWMHTLHQQLNSQVSQHDSSNPNSNPHPSTHGHTFLQHLPSLKQLLNQPDLSSSTLLSKDSRVILKKFALEEKMGRGDIHFSHCTFQHFIETYFFSLEKFFQLPLFALNGITYQWSQDSPSPAFLENKTFHITQAAYTALEAACHHTLPNFFLPIQYRALGIYQQALDISGISFTSVPLDGTPPSSDSPQRDAESIATLLHLLQFYLEANFPLSPQPEPSTRKVQQIQWLILENEPDWEATVRIQGIRILRPPTNGVSSKSPPEDLPLLSSTTSPFELTGDVETSALEAKASCALRCLEYFAALEAKLLATLGLSDEQCIQDKVHFIDARTYKDKDLPCDPHDTPTTQSIIHMEPHPTLWENVSAQPSLDPKSFHLIFDSSHSLTSISPIQHHYFTPQTLRDLQLQQRFRFVPLRHTLSTPHHKFALAQTVQSQFRAQEKYFKWTHHNALFEPNEDVISASLHTKKTNT